MDVNEGQSSADQGATASRGIAICVVITMIVLTSIATKMTAPSRSESNLRASNGNYHIDDRPVLPGLYETVTLGTGGCSGEQTAALDIYLSPNRDGQTILLLPGGGYMTHVSDTIKKVGAEYIKSNYTVAILYYRLPC